MMGISTHVLDTAKGRPAAGVRLLLLRDEQLVFDGITDGDGRARLAERAEPGTYRLTFDTGAYNPGGFFPEATIVFRIENAEQHYHVPLLLSPFGYSTYRGS
ncbi:MAG TPA: hydroxyisourate hydrolase [Thermoanaerobaculia bacterium]|nr:hydroxyisourate hydrolase [Thermoanaerobaculia bacterium]